MSAERVQTLAPLTVGGVDVTVSSSGADQDGSSTLRTLHEGQVADGAVMHAELQVWAWPQRDINTHETGSEVPIGPAPKYPLSVPVALHVSALKGRTLTYLSLEPVASSCPQWLQATQ